MAGRCWWVVLLAVAGCKAQGQEVRRDATTSKATQGEASGDSSAELARLIRERYTKHEHMVPMRDGARLFTTVYVPKDRAQPAPMLLMRTPYSVAPYGADQYPAASPARVLQRFAPSPRFVREGYIMVHQDVRGRMMSEGTFVDVRPYNPDKKGQEFDESSDAYDTIDWLVKNVPSNNGKVGVWGISYPGFYAAQAAIDAHPALKAVSPQAPVTEWFLGDDFHHNGALFLEDAFDFYASFGKPRPAPTSKSSWGFDYSVEDRYQFFLQLGPLANVNERYFKGERAFWNDLVAHGTRDDFWKARDPRPHLKNIRPATMVVGGWFDAEDVFGALETYKAIERQGGARSKNTLVMGPWRHGGWARSDGDSLGDISFGAKTSLWYQEHLEFPFFDRYLRGKGDEPRGEAWVFETGTNEWRTHDAWPPKASREATLWLQPSGRLGASEPGASEPGFDEYISDPAKPVPFRGRVSGERGPEYMIDDQRFAAVRPDVLTYTSKVLDGDVTLAGPLRASLWVSTTGTDADFVVKLIDVLPEGYPAPEPNPRGVLMGGYQQLIRGEVMRGKFRESFEAPRPFVPGEPAQVRFSLPDVNHTFRAGHRIMVQVQSTWFPLVDRNPQTFVDIYRCGEADFKKATHRVFVGGGRPSGVTVTLLKGALPG